MRRPRSRLVEVVTDSTASLGRSSPATVVPLLVDDGRVHHEGEEFTGADVVASLQSKRRVTTSGPPPAAFERAYAAAAARGAVGVVSVHLSGELSGTVRSAALAASRAPLPVRVLDSRTVAMGLGFAVLAAARFAAAGASLDDVARRAARVADATTASFCVDSLDHLRRGGRLSPAAATWGAVFGVRPLIAVAGGRLELVTKVRGHGAAIDRLVGDATAAIERCAEPAWAVQGVGLDDLAERVAQRLVASTGVAGMVTPLGAVLAAHVGPGTVAIIVADLVDGC